MVNQLKEVAVRVSDVGIVVSIIVPEPRLASGVEGHLQFGKVGHHPFPVWDLHSEVVGLQERGVLGIVAIDLRGTKVNLQLPGVPW